jgi:hypothetical protein
MIDATELIRTIREAFRDVKLEDGVSLNMTEYNDSGGSVERFKQLAVNDERDDWQRIDDKTLEEFTVTFSFTDWKGFRFYLPAYMIWMIVHPESTSIIGEHTVYALDPDRMVWLHERTVDKILSKQQIEAVVQFLRYCVDGFGYHDADAAANLGKMTKYL